MEAYEPDMDSVATENNERDLAHSGSSLFPSTWAHHSNVNNDHVIKAYIDVAKFIKKYLKIKRLYNPVFPVTSISLNRDYMHIGDIWMCFVIKHHQLICFSPLTIPVRAHEYQVWKNKLLFFMEIRCSPRSSWINPDITIYVTDYS